MGEKDMTQKTLEAYNDVFADILNVLLFKGGQVVQEDSLEEESPRSMYKADGKLHEQERDVAKYWKNGKVRIALYGLENQVQSDRDMPLRLFSYDGAAYRAQLLAGPKRGGKKKKTGRKKKTGGKKTRYPVVTLVLYFGYKNHWNQPLTLTECLRIPEELRPYVNDYRMNLFEIAWLEEEQVNQFRSDFRIVADYFVQKRRNRDYVPSDMAIQHVHEFLQLMSAMTGDYRFEEVYDSDMEGRSTNMCEVLDRVEQRGIEKGMQQGLQQGMQQGLQQGMQQGLQQGMQQGLQQGLQAGKQQGLEQGERSVATLFSFLLANDRLADLKRAADDEAYRHELMAELFPDHNK